MGVSQTRQVSSSIPGPYAPDANMTSCLHVSQPRVCPGRVLESRGCRAEPRGGSTGLESQAPALGPGPTPYKPCLRPHFRGDTMSEKLGRGALPPSREALT